MKKLRAEALSACKFRGHEMANWWFTLKGTRIIGGTVCRKCGMDVQIDTEPPPNGINVAGQAVALHCTG